MDAGGEWPRAACCLPMVCNCRISLRWRTVRRSMAPCSAVTRGVACPARKHGLSPCWAGFCPGPLLVHSCVPLGANVEGAGGGVGHAEHGVGVVAVVCGPEFGKEPGFYIVPQIEVFIRMDVLGEGLVRDRGADMNRGLLAKIHADREAESEMLGSGEVPKDLEVSD